MHVMAYHLHCFYSVTQGSGIAVPLTFAVGHDRRTGLLRVAPLVLTDTGDEGTLARHAGDVRLGAWHT